MNDTMAAFGELGEASARLNLRAERISLDLLCVIGFDGRFGCA
jgi:uncharacterized protein with ACT and thioredoxin-like domain